MKDIKIELNASNASGEAYWRKRCDTVEAELSRLRAELHRADIALSESPFHGQEELAEASLVDGIRNYRSAVEAELALLRAANAELERKVNDIAGDAAKNIVDATAQEDENKRLRAANEELANALWRIRDGRHDPALDLSQTSPFQPERTEEERYREWVRRDQDCAMDAISSAEQAGKAEGSRK